MSIELSLFTLKMAIEQVIFSYFFPINYHIYFIIAGKNLGKSLYLFNNN